MDLHQIDQIAEKLMGNRKVHQEREIGGALHHGRRVANTALSLRKIILPADSARDDVLRVAAWFHDVGKGLEPHARYGGIIVQEALKNVCTERQLAQIAELVTLHANSKLPGDAYPDLLKILQDADLLDHYGTYAIWMEFLYSAYTGKTIQQTYTYDPKTWTARCEKHRASLHYDISKRIFDERLAFVDSFYDRFRIEGQGGIIDLETLL